MSERLEKIEQVASLVSLQECAQLRRDQFLARKDPPMNTPSLLT
jgi:hypothetical protein